MRIITLNANGIRSATRKGFVEWMRRQRADVVCLQEIRARPEQMARKAAQPGGYHAFFHPAERPGYSGVGIYVKEEPKRVHRSLDWPEWDREGRFLQVDLDKVSVISLYLNSGSASEARQQVKFGVMDRLMPILEGFTKSGREYLICGDWNIAHKEIDLKNWRGNRKNSGFLPEEREWMSHLFNGAGYVDAFRVVNKEPDQYTWWSNRGQAWAKNVGWRIDYQVATPGIGRRAQRVSVYKRKRFSDHAPLTIDYDL